MEWIRFNERLPKEDCAFLTITTECEYLIRHTNTIHGSASEVGIFTPAHHGRGTELTHWMPLPAPPKRSD